MLNKADLVGPAFVGPDVTVDIVSAEGEVVISLPLPQGRLELSDYRTALEDGETLSFNGPVRVPPKPVRRSRIASPRKPVFETGADADFEMPRSDKMLAQFSAKLKEVTDRISKQADRRFELEFQRRRRERDIQPAVVEREEDVQSVGGSEVDEEPPQSEADQSEA